MKSITVNELKQLIDRDEQVQIIDIREEDERDICAIKGSVHIPMAEVLSNTDRLSKEGTVVIHCKAGDRASAVVLLLNTKHGIDNVYNLAGGIIAWANTIDPQMAVY